MPIFHVNLKQKRHTIVAEDELDAAFMVIHNLPKYFDIDITDDYGNVIAQANDRTVYKHMVLFADPIENPDFE